MDKLLKSVDKSYLLQIWTKLDCNLDFVLAITKRGITMFLTKLYFELKKYRKFLKSCRKNFFIIFNRLIFKQLETARYRHLRTLSRNPILNPILSNSRILRQ